MTWPVINCYLDNKAIRINNCVLQDIGGSSAQSLGCPRNVYSTPKQIATHTYSCALPMNHGIVGFGYLTRRQDMVTCKCSLLPPLHTLNVCVLLPPSWEPWPKLSLGQVLMLDLPQTLCQIPVYLSFWFCWADAYLYEFPLKKLHKQMMVNHA